MFRSLPKSAALYRLCMAYVNDYRGDNAFAIEENGELRLAQRVLPRMKTAFDVGANVGDWTELALQINPALQIHCFEPTRSTFATLSAKPFPSTVHLNSVALGDSGGERELYVVGEGSGANSLYRRTGVPSLAAGSQRVSVRTVDDYAAEHGIDAIDFLKIDVEGHELSVLRGARRMLGAGAIAVVQFEYGGSYIDSRALLKDVWDLVAAADAGYTFYKIFPNELRRESEYLQTFETFQYSNWAIVRRDWETLLS